MSLSIRPATEADVPLLIPVIDRCVRQLGAGHYTPHQLDLALVHVFGVDTQLLRDRSYYIVEDGSGTVLGCGGWSYRRTLYGSDNATGRCPEELDPARDAAKIRAFFVDPAAVRQGVASLILNECENAARARGFTGAELMAMKSGVKFYTTKGFIEDAPHTHMLTGECGIEFIGMHKSLV